MAKLFITEFSAVQTNPQATQQTLPVAQLPPVAQQAVTFTASTQSASLNAETKFVRVQADANCCITVGTNPTATVNDLPLTAGVPEYFGVKAGDKIAAVTV